MSAEDLAQILSVPGRLAYNPTQAGLAQAYPHGGTALGFKNDFHIEETEQFAPIRAEEWGQVVGGVRGYTTYAIAFRIIQWDKDALALIYPTSTTSQTNQLNALNVSEKTPGLLTPVSPIAFSPDDPANPGAVIYAPLPWLGPTGARTLDYILTKRLEVPTYFLASRNANGRTVKYGRLADLPLP